MRRRERRHEDENEGSERQNRTPGNDGDIRAEGQRLLDTVDDVLNRALSGDSRAFLSANRQEGGQ